MADINDVIFRGPNWCEPKTDCNRTSRPRQREIRSARKAKQQQRDQMLDPITDDDAFGHADAGQVRRMVEENRP